MEEKANSQVMKGWWQNLWADWGGKGADNYILLGAHRACFHSELTLYKCASKIFTQHPTTKLAGLGRNTSQNFHVKPSTWYLVHFTFYPSESPIFTKVYENENDSQRYQSLQVLWDFKSDSCNSVWDIPSVVSFSCQCHLKNMQLN